MYTVGIEGRVAAMIFLPDTEEICHAIIYTPSDHHSYRVTFSQDTALCLGIGDEIFIKTQLDSTAKTSFPEPFRRDSEKPQDSASIIQDLEERKPFIYLPTIYRRVGRLRNRRTNECS